MDDQRLPLGFKLFIVIVGVFCAFVWAVLLWVTVRLITS